jgi:hypothetical protein
MILAARNINTKIYKAGMKSYDVKNLVDLAKVNKN